MCWENKIKSDKSIQANPKVEVDIWPPECLNVIPYFSVLCSTLPIINMWYAQEKGVFQIGKAKLSPFVLKIGKNFWTNSKPADCPSRFIQPHPYLVQFPITPLPFGLLRQPTCSNTKTKVFRTFYLKIKNSPFNLQV